MFRRQRRPGPVRPSTQRRQLDRRSLGSAERPVEAGTSWLGSPAIFLPRRRESPKFEEARTFCPPVRLVACRLAIEFFRVVLPPTFLFAFLILLTASCVRLAEFLPAEQPWLLAAVLPGFILSGPSC